MATADAAERLLNLIIALTHARIRMTRAQIRMTVAGYDPADPSDDDATAKRRTAAFERMFERDKEDLRRLGIPLRTVTDAAHGDDIGYVIDASEAALPTIELTQAERAALAVAADYWQSATLGTDARRAFSKLAAVTARGEAEPLPLAASSMHDADAAAPFAQAIHDRQAVQFTYTSASAGRATRTVEPWRLIARGGALYLVAHDRDRGQARTFRVSRVESDVTPFGETHVFDVPDQVTAFQLAADVPEMHARVALRAEAGHQLRRRGTFVESDGDWDVFDVPYVDTYALRDEVLGLMGRARVVAPADLAQDVVRAARAAADACDG